MKTLFDLDFLKMLSWRLNAISACFLSSECSIEFIRYFSWYSLSFDSRRIKASSYYWAIWWSNLFYFRYSFMSSLNFINFWLFSILLFSRSFWMIYFSASDGCSKISNWSDLSSTYLSMSSISFEVLILASLIYFS